MALYKNANYKDMSSEVLNLSCDICTSDDIIETIEGYTCRNCGVVLEIQNLHYSRPYNRDIIQYAKGLGYTHMGTRREREYSPYSVDLQRRNRRNMEQNNYGVVLQRASIQISKLFEYLALLDSLREDVVKKFKEVYSNFRPGTKYRNPEKLVAIILYYILKFRNIARSEVDFLECADITKKEFNQFKLQVRKYLPIYEEHNRQEYILRKLFHIKEQFDLDMAFYYSSKEVLLNLWNIIKHTKDDVIAGLCSSIVALCAYQVHVNVNSICRELHIRMSTIQAQVEKKIFDQFRIKGFTTLVRSSDILREVIKTLGILERAQDGEAPEIIEVRVGNASLIYTAHDEGTFYLCAIKDTFNTIMLITLDWSNPLGILDKSYCKSKDPVGDLTIWKFINGKGPPLELPVLS